MEDASADVNTGAFLAHVASLVAEIGDHREAANCDRVPGLIPGGGGGVRVGNKDFETEDAGS